MTTRHNACVGVAVITVLAVSAALAGTVFVDDDNCPRPGNRHDGTIVRGAYASVSDGHSTTSGPVWSFTVELRTGDVDGDGIVSVADFLVLLAAWGVCDEPCPPSCPADFDDDCAVGILDLLILLGNW